MKRIFLLSEILLIVCSIQAQDIFKKHGFNKELLTLSKGHYKEVFTNDEVVQVGTVLLNIHTNKVIEFLEEDTTQLAYTAEVAGRFLSMDPLAEKYPWMSPYAYCMNNPIKYIDPDGRDIVITGVLSQEALQQLQSRIGDRITLSMNDAGRVSYSMNTDKKLKGDAKRMAGMINDGSIIVNIVTTDKKETSTGNLMVGGAFMGNTVTTDADGNIVSARQEINPRILGSADEHTRTPGKMIMHETTEAYQGGKISKRSGISSPRSNIDGSVYEKAHNRATSQSLVSEIMYDRNGNSTVDINKAVRVEWSVSKNGKIKIIQTLP